MVLTNNIEAERVIEEEGLDKEDFQLIVNQWHERDLLDGLIRKYRLGGDCYFPEVNNLQEEIKQLRFSLLPEEIERYRSLRRETAKIMTDVCRAIKSGETENEIITDDPEWPKVEVEYNKEKISSSGILVGG